MGYYWNAPRRDQRGRRRWSRFLFPLIFLLIFVFTQSLAGFLVSLAIIVLLWALIAAASSSSHMWNPPLQQQPPMQQPVEPLYTPPESEAPYEQGYMGVPPAAQPSQQQQAEESDRLAQLALIGDLYHAGTLTKEEFERQKQRILQAGATQAGATKEAGALEAPTTEPSEAGFEDQPQAQYEQELPPVQQR